MCEQNNELHPNDCVCHECMPEPSYWNGIDSEWHRKEINRRQNSRYNKYKDLVDGD